MDLLWFWVNEPKTKQKAVLATMYLKSVYLHNNLFDSHLLQLQMIIELPKMCTVLLNHNCEKRISYKFTGRHLALFYSEFCGIFIIIAV